MYAYRIVNTASIAHGFSLSLRFYGKWVVFSVSSKLIHNDLKCVRTLAKNHIVFVSSRCESRLCTHLHTHTYVRRSSSDIPSESLVQLCYPVCPRYLKLALCWSMPINKVIGAEIIETQKCSPFLFIYF